jgi:hypothetical protein
MIAPATVTLIDGTGAAVMPTNHKPGDDLNGFLVVSADPAAIAAYRRVTQAALNPDSSTSADPNPDWALIRACVDRAESIAVAAGRLPATEGKALLEGRRLAS